MIDCRAFDWAKWARGFWGDSDRDRWSWRGMWTGGRMVDNVVGVVVGLDRRPFRVIDCSLDWAMWKRTADAGCGRSDDTEAWTAVES